MTGENRRFGILVGLMLSLLGLTVWAAATGRLTEDHLQSFVAAGGMWSPLVFVLLATIAPLAWVPRMMTSIVAGALFGFWMGALLALVGGVGGGLAGYWVGKSLGNDFVMRKIGPRGKAVADFLARRGLLAIALGRISPVTNCEAISLGSGLIGLPMRVYIPSTIIGMTPGSLLYAAFGSSVLTENARWASAASATVALLMTIGTGFWLWHMWKRDKADQFRRLERAVEHGDAPSR